VNLIFATEELAEQAVKSLAAEGYRARGSVRLRPDGFSEVIVGADDESA